MTCPTVPPWASTVGGAFARSHFTKTSSDECNQTRNHIDNKCDQAYQTSNVCQTQYDFCYIKNHVDIGDSCYCDKDLGSIIHDPLILKMKLPDKNCGYTCKTDHGICHTKQGFIGSLCSCGINRENGRRINLEGTW